MSQKFKTGAAKDFINSINRIVYQKYGNVLDIKILHELAEMILNERIEKEILPFIEAMTNEQLTNVISETEKYVIELEENDFLIERDDKNKKNVQ